MSVILISRLSPLEKEPFLVLVINNNKQKPLDIEADSFNCSESSKGLLINLKLYLISKSKEF